MISEGSCDTEDWSNDAENSACITGVNLEKKVILNWFHNITVFDVFFVVVFLSNKCSLGEHKRLKKKSYQPQIFEW